MKTFWIATLAISSVLGQAFAAPSVPNEFEMECGPWKIREAPYPSDFRKAKPSYIQVVELAHFAPNVENLVRPMFLHFGADFNYTLHTFPNHPRALAALNKLGVLQKTDQPKGLAYPIDCYYRRAIRWTPDDLIPRMLYAQYLGRVKRRADALTQLATVDQLADVNNPMTRNNLGLLYMQFDEFDKALQQAHMALAQGLLSEDLRTKLQAAGRWKEPVAAPAGAASAPAAAAPAASAPASAASSGGGQ